MIHNIFGHINYKSIAIIFVIFSIISFFNSSIPAFAQQQQGINWLEICRNPLVKAMISERCEDLTTPDGYTLTPEGEHVLACLGGGTFLLIGHPELLALKNAVGYGENSDNSTLSNTQSDQSSSQTSFATTSPPITTYDPNTNSLITENQTSSSPSISDNQSSATSSENATAPSNQNMVIHSHAGASDQF